MYKHTLLFICFFVTSIIAGFSQNHVDALRYSQQFYSGSSKSEAMGNSLSAVGADFSSYIINPAGIALFKGNQLALTPNFIVSKTSANFAGDNTKDGRIGFNFSNAGYVSVHKTNGILKSFSLGIAYNSYNDFRQRTYVTANNQKASLLDYITYNANNDRYSDFREDLAYETELLDIQDNEYYNRITDFAKYGNSQTKTINTKGGGGEFSFTLGFNINDILYLGGTIGLTSINYTYNSTYSEKGFDELWFTPDLSNPNDSVLVNPNSFKYTEELQTEGSGINAKFGFLFQPVKFLRFGGAIHSVTAYDFKDFYKASMHSDFPVPDENGAYSYNAEAENTFEWRLTTPLRANAGLAIILDSYPISKYYTVPITFSIDYEYVDYSKAFLRDVEGGEYSFNEENSNIQKFYVETHNLKAGAELNFGKIKIRGGYSIYSNPYNNNEGMFANAKMTYSGGIGFANEQTFIDFAYSFSPTNETLNLYEAGDVFPNNPMGNLIEPKAGLANSKQFFKITLGLRL